MAWPTTACLRGAAPCCKPHHAHAVVALHAKAAPRRQARDQGQRRGRRGVLPPCAAAAQDVGEGSYHTDNHDGQTVEQRLRMVQNMVTTAELLVPYDRSAVNLGLIIWGAIRSIPAKDRMQLLSRLTAADITRLWKIAGQRYTAPKQQVAAAIGAEYSLWKDLPAASTEVSTFRGKAALPMDALGLVSSFSKAFFLQPEGDQLYGRVLLGKTPLGDVLYPLYFKASVGPGVVPTTQELCDVTLRYLPPQQLGLSRDDLPRSGWPQPRAHLPPFHDGFTDYLRAVAPGVYVGLGYRTASTEFNAPLYFLMVHEQVESLI
ncbi:hypothetical protein D9Q98_005408 [Chlorella vulgaris]|uniref:Uncharacterized protein n=1 Tax=Chlorella vulgaris TaxID=3077 RepID=A0A9D4TM01_CHLVU|nr:hypothetical protein D9Q98_005408 [Chlorella vulgaris]